MIELLQAMASAYGNFWLWAWGGATGAYVWMVLVVAILGTAMMAIPLVYGIGVVEQNRRAERFPDEFTKPPRWKLALAFLAGPMFFVSLIFTLGLGIGGGEVYHSNFRECVQVEDRTVHQNPQTVTFLMCRDRNHTEEPWSEWSVAAVQLGNWVTVPMVEKLP